MKLAGAWHCDVCRLRIPERRVNRKGHDFHEAACFKRVVWAEVRGGLLSYSQALQLIERPPIVWN